MAAAGEQQHVPRLQDVGHTERQAELNRILRIFRLGMVQHGMTPRRIGQCCDVRMGFEARSRFVKSNVPIHAKPHDGQIDGTLSLKDFSDASTLRLRIGGIAPERNKSIGWNP